MTGARGVLVEPNPQLASVLRRKRPRDTILQCGVGVGEAKGADYYMFDSHTLNTFSQSEALRYSAMGEKQLGAIRIDLKNVNEILELVSHLDFINLDIEGLDLEILKGIDWDKYRPATLCVETITYETEKEPEKLEGIHSYLSSLGYKVYADTFINTIFLDGRIEGLWNRRY